MNTDPDVKSDLPLNTDVSLAKGLTNEDDMSPLHLACYAGAENTVRVNSLIVI